MNRITALAALLMAVLALAPMPLLAAKRWTQAADGTGKVFPASVDKRFRNAQWPDPWERDFWKRANHVIRNTARPDTRSYGNTFFENEKRSYGWAMLSILGGYEADGLGFLQREDNMAERWNKHTLGIDYYPCFTLKHQMRKYFFFGEHLDPAYRRRMKDAASVFTEKDPLRRPHYAYTGRGMWGPKCQSVARQPSRLSASDASVSNGAIQWTPSRSGVTENCETGTAKNRTWHTGLSRAI